MTRKTLKKIYNFYNTHHFLKLFYIFIPENLKKRNHYLIINPYSQFELNNNIIFIHVPKNAGNGITKSLFDCKASGHYPALHYKIYSKDRYKRFFKFGIVRNPWDRLVSAFFYIKQGGMNQSDKNVNEKFLQDKTFKQFVIDLQNDNFKKDLLKEIHFIPQYKFLCINDKVQVNFLGRFENLDTDFIKLKDILKRPNAQLKNDNKSEHKPYWEYYDDEMIKIVGEIYSKDIEIFGYSFR